MGRISWLFFSIQGRISRRSWWLGLVTLLVIDEVATRLLWRLLGISPPTGIADFPAWLTAGASAGWASFAIAVLLAYPAYAVSVKRRHDRDTNGLDVAANAAFGILWPVPHVLGIGWEIGFVYDVAVPVPTWWFAPIVIAAITFGIYLNVVLGLLKGTDGPNRYGPDPIPIPRPSSLGGAGDGPHAVG
jgi:uncharacterized membrane protein YhaH (DUF805 family)